MSTHIPVLLQEALEALAVKPGGIYVDGTFGLGGYSAAILATPDTKVYAIDRDPSAIAAGQELAQKYKQRLTLIHGRFSEMPRLLAPFAVQAVDGVVLDVGVSSPQLDDAERGFSFRADGPLDMRMSSEGRSAADIVNSAAEDKLANLIYRLGEERRSRAIARAIVQKRLTQKFQRTSELAEIIRSVVRADNSGIDPATRSFQALRLAVNDELPELMAGLMAAEELLNADGRLAVVSFHSLEDRIVKDFLRHRSGDEESVSRHLPLSPQRQAASFKLVQRKPVIASDAERDRNPRARSAKLRWATRLNTPPQQTPPPAFSEYNFENLL